MHATLSAREAAEKLGLSYSTLKSWLDRLPLAFDRNARGEYRIDPAALDLLEAVKGWRQDDKGLDTIAKLIGPKVASDGLAVDEPLADHEQATPANGQVAPAGMVASADLLPMVQEVSRLALALAETSYRQGQLEADLRNVQGQADEARQREQVANERVARFEREAAELRRRLEAEQARPWWRRLLGGKVLPSIVVAAGVLTVTVQATAQVMVATDPGTWSGGRFSTALQQQGYEAMLVRGFVRGFVSGINVYAPASGGDSLKGADYEGAEAWLLKYGTDKPLDNLFAATSALIETRTPKLKPIRMGR